MHPFKLLLFSAALLIPVAAQTVQPCQALVAVGRTPTQLGQYKLTISYPKTCVRPVLFVRIKTTGGGTIYPPIGHFRISAGYPREFSYYVWPGAHPQQKEGDVWQDLPIRNQPQDWFARGVR